MSHTPGPWRVHSEVPNRIILNGSACYEVVDLVRLEQYHNYADMRLIAAAPELLAALKQAVTALNVAKRFTVQDTDSYQIASACDAAIRRAEGRTDG